jgi:hypothetical protein
VVSRRANERYDTGALPIDGVFSFPYRGIA